MSTPTYLITGGTTGIGLASAQLLAKQGARVIVTGRNPDTLHAAGALLPAGVIRVRSDSGSIDDSRGLGTVLRTHTERLDGVFLNAGTGRFGPFDGMTPELYDEMFSVNVRGPYFQLQSLLPLLANPSSVVVNTSVASDLAMVGTSIYAATKAALSSLGRTLAVELAPRGVRVNAVSPGPIRTPIYDKLGMGPDDLRGFEASMAAQTALRRFGTPDEVAALVAFLIGPSSGYITGDEITIDGGFRHT
jgi:NAD(P)-dependent dehydrogenase (short-subunit alcohol dehydrogenase family)